MIKNRPFPSLILFAVLLAACAPGAASTNPPAAATQPPTALSPTETAPATMVEPSAEAAALPLATSRGPALHATDPTTVSLASGGLQFVEFFRFT